MNTSSTPAFISTSSINISGEAGKRLMVVYRTKGCEYDRKGRGCTMCDFAHYADPHIGDEDIVAQHKQFTLPLLEQGGGSQVDLLTLGNFYNDREVSPTVRRTLLSEVAKVTSVKRILTESRRGYVTPEKLSEAKSFLRGDQTLVYAFGYETQDRLVRNRVLNKGVPESHLDQCMQICRASGVDFAAYVLVKPPSMSEKVAIKDAVETAIHVLQKASVVGIRAYVAFEPVFVIQTKTIDALYRSGDYTPPTLWSVVAVIERTAETLGLENTAGRIFVGLSDEGLSGGRMAHGCGVCDQEVMTAVQRFNADQDISRLRHLHCVCKEPWEKAIAG